MTTLFTDGLPRRPLAQLCITGSSVGAGFHVFVIKRHPARSERGGWMGVGGSRAHPRRAASPRQPLGSQLGQSSAPLQAHPCPPFHGPYVDGVSQRPGKCLVFHQAGGKRLARLSEAGLTSLQKTFSLPKSSSPSPASPLRTRMSPQPLTCETGIPGAIPPRYCCRHHSKDGGQCEGPVCLEAASDKG